MAIIIVFALLLAVLYYYQYPRAGDGWLRLQQRFYERRLGLTTAYAEVDNLSLCYYDSAPHASSKPLLVLVHGFSSDRTVWMTMLDGLSHHFRILIPDLPGHGDSEKIEPSLFTTDNMALMFWQWLDSITTSSVHLVGHSVGGKIVTQMTVLRPEQVASLVLQCPAGLHGPTPTKVERLIREGRNPFVATNNDDYAFFYGLLMARPPWMPRVVKDAMSQRYQRNVAYMEALFNVIAPSGKPNIDALSKVNPPTLLLWGAKDEVISVESIAGWEHGWSPEKVIFYDCGHTPALEAPARTKWAMLWFYRRHFHLELKAR